MNVADTEIAAPRKVRTTITFINGDPSWSCTFDMNNPEQGGRQAVLRDDLKNAHKGYTISLPTGDSSTIYINPANISRVVIEEA